MRFIPPLLAKLWPPAPLASNDPMNSSDEGDRGADPISCALDAAVDEHARTACDALDTYDRRIRQTMDELLERIGHPS